ncbi:hypothetical protein POM88_011494 [Heracleum sosnowskyi]|uniref:Uncharacterized protein n=1 Tax=Heracleum sosnowskyi TaxID=360622 RepID=A0AAD8IWB8_9APIA|nr:hypothetical protein POM88_011494 [Heracleum sosnowskyi]
MGDNGDKVEEAPAARRLRCSEASEPEEQSETDNLWGSGRATIATALSDLLQQAWLKPVQQLMDPLKKKEVCLSYCLKVEESALLVFPGCEIYVVSFCRVCFDLYAASKVINDHLYQLNLILLVCTMFLFRDALRFNWTLLVSTFPSSRQDGFDELGHMDYRTVDLIVDCLYSVHDTVPEKGKESRGLASLLSFSSCLDDFIGNAIFFSVVYAEEGSKQPDHYHT